jgi:biotin carboxylase
LSASAVDNRSIDLSQFKSVLIATTTWWPIASRLAVVLTEMGVPVAIVCPHGNPALALNDRLLCSFYNPIAPCRALADALARSGCHLVIACDDRVIAHLHSLHTTHPELRPVIERSIGPSSSYKIIESRVALLAFAAEAGLRVPETHAVPNSGALVALAGAMPFPWFMKLDGTWGGAGVRRVDDLAGARRSWLQFGRLAGTVSALKQFIINRNQYPLLPMPRQKPARICVQQLIEGRPANVIATAWNGEVVGAICFAALQTRSPFGTAVVVRAIDQPEMLEHARVLAHRLRLSGYFGLDFVIEERTGAAFLIEMNPRTTPLGHLRIGPQHDLPGALIGRAMAQPIPPVDVLAGNQVVALFPDARNFGVEQELLASAFQDIPVTRPELVRELMLPPYAGRGAWARAFAWAGHALARRTRSINLARYP